MLGSIFINGLLLLSKSTASILVRTLPELSTILSTRTIYVTNCIVSPQTTPRTTILCWNRCPPFFEERLTSFGTTILTTFDVWLTSSILWSETFSKVSLPMSCDSMSQEPPKICASGADSRDSAWTLIGRPSYSQHGR